MEYEIQLTHIGKAPIGPQGVVEPLCDSCLAPDCSNPIREKIVSVMGIPKKMRLHVIGNVFRQVIECRGYVGDKHVPMADIPQGPISPQGGMR